MISARKKASIKSIKDEIKGLKETLKNITAHKQKDCQAGNHITRGFATGGRDGDYLTYCLCCDYSEHGYD